MRYPNDICLLCLDKKADKKGSHFTPAGILKKVIGERDYEDLYSIDAADSTIVNFKGRSNLDNTDPTIRPAEHTADYIFCKECEIKLSAIESACIQKLNALSDSIEQNTAVIALTSQNNSFIEVKIHKNFLILLFYSIIWRQFLKAFLDSNIIIISQPFMEKLREIVKTGIYQSKTELENHDFSQSPALQILTSKHRADKTINFFNPNTRITNPFLVNVGIYDAFIYFREQITEDIKPCTGYSQNILDDALNLNNSTKSVICVANETEWTSKIASLAADYANQFHKTAINKLASEKNISIEIAGNLLITLSVRMHEVFPDKKYADCLASVLNDLLYREKDLLLFMWRNL